MRVSRSGYYSYLESRRKTDIDPDDRLVFEIKLLHKKSRGSYGSRRMAKALSMSGYIVGRHKVRRLMRENGVSCKQRRRYKVTTKSDSSLPVAENLLNRNFEAQKPNEKWATDITYLWTNEGYLYLAAVIDLFSRRIVGWAMADNMQTDLVEKAFSMAMLRRCPEAGLLHHSDRGSQYTSLQYRQLLDTTGVVASMSRKGNCWDNAVMERFFGSLKSEQTDDKCYATRAEIESDVIDYIETFYNTERLHSTLNYMSPADYEANFEGDIKSKLSFSVESRMKTALPAAEARL